MGRGRAGRRSVARDLLLLVLLHLLGGPLGLLERVVERAPQGGELRRAGQGGVQLREAIELGQLGVDELGDAGVERRERLERFAMRPGLFLVDGLGGEGQQRLADAGLVPARIEHAADDAAAPGGLVEPQQVGDLVEALLLERVDLLEGRRIQAGQLDVGVEFPDQADRPRREAVGAAAADIDAAAETARSPDHECGCEKGQHAGQDDVEPVDQPPLADIHCGRYRHRRDSRTLMLRNRKTTVTARKKTTPSVVISPWLN